MGLEWVGSLGGPLVVVPVSALPQWGGADGEVDADGADDYARACAVDALAGVVPVGRTDGVVPVGRTAALVLGDEPAETVFLPEQRVFVRWLAADSAADVLATAHALVTDADVEWDDCGVWETDGPAVLMDSAYGGADLDEDFGDGSEPEWVVAPVPAGCWRVRATRHTAGGTWVGLVRLLSDDGPEALGHG